ncbi:MAG TPA: acyl-CoA thioesterase domain-containing protein [Polyangiales bacterium]|nr:acyl-CoA thioesterase domain-containing protein [Polyangiales bacterium]
MSEPATERSTEEKAIASILRRLDVQRSSEDGDEFVAQASRQPGPRLFGGLVAGQAVIAAARTVSGLSLHSLHAYFLQPGDPDLEVRYRVQRLKEGKNFHARMVTGQQNDRVIFSMQASFVRPEPGFAHQDPMPDAPTPESIPDSGWGFWGASSPVRLRDCDGSFERSAERGGRRLWMRPAAPLPEDPVLHLGMLVFASDMSLVMTGLLPHPELRRRPRGGASLDHALWFHRPPAFDDWLLYTMQTPAAHDGRPLITGAMYRRDGTRVVSVAQEGLIRPR